MMNGCRPATILAVMLLATFASIVICPGADVLKWDAPRDRVDATVETWTVPQLLQRVAKATGWQIYLDPAITNRIPTRFSDKEPGDALRRLLGNYSFALVPETNSAAKLFVFRNSRDQATRIIEALADKKPSNLISNELIVTLKAGENIDALAKKLGAKVAGRADALHAYRLQFGDAEDTANARAALANEKGDESVDSNYSITIPDGARQFAGGVPFNLSPVVSPDGKYTIVGLVDTAVQGKQAGISDFLTASFSTSDKQTVATETDGPLHGTSMAEAILKGANNGLVRIASADIYNGSESTTMFEVGYGIYKVVNDGHATIVNLSLGGEGESKFVDGIIDDIRGKGVLVVGAAGNDHTANRTEPAANDNVIAVTALGPTGEIANYANFGDFVDVAAPGTVMISFDGRFYAVTGTSTSTALVSGLVAKIATDTHKPPAEVDAIVRKMLAVKTK